jgi:NADPH:quinone reductase
MLAMRIDMHGGTEVLRTVQVPTPAPGPGQVLVRHEAIGVNFVDTQHRAGAPYPVELPLIPGIEAAGRVEGVGAGVEGIREGDRVAYAGPMVGVMPSLPQCLKRCWSRSPTRLRGRRRRLCCCRG